MESPNAREIAEKNERRQIYTEALQKWGYKFQFLILIEEMSELTKEIIKYQRKGNNVPDIIEEIGDVEIMIEQVKQYFDINHTVEEWKNIKIKRLKKLLES